MTGWSDEAEDMGYEASPGSLAEAIEQRRADPEFAQRMRARIETDADLLDRLGAPQPEADDRG